MFARTSMMVAFVLVVAGCPDAAPPGPTPPNSTAPLAGREPTPEPAEPEPAEPSPVEPPVDAPSVERWRFTTLVTGGPEPLIGSNGFYELELELEGDRVALRKVGQTGTPSFAASEVLSGAGTAQPIASEVWPGAERRTLAITLGSGEAARELGLDLWRIGDELHGVWWFPDPKAEKLGRAWGLVVGRREFGDPIELRNGDDAACMTCVQAIWNCDGVSFEPACNSANQAASACERRLAKARANNDPLPRGC